MEPLRQRKSMRLKGYDYSKNGCYFITICTKNKECLFGNIVDGAMRLNTYGKIANDELMKTAIKRRDVLINNYVIMPNHVHILMTLYDNGERCCTSDTARRVPTEEQFGKPTKNSIPTIIRSYKSATTMAIRANVGTRRAVSGITPDVYIIWQSRYHDHIIRNEKSFQKIHNYIENNPMQWEFDCHNPMQQIRNVCGTNR